MNNVAILAHYDKNNEIQNYVIYYIKELSKVTKTIIFVSDSDINDSELNKIRPYVTHAIVGKHGEYDFGSYKRGYFYAKEKNLLNECNELILANDSCYAPLFPFEEMFTKMSPQEVDFWGVTENDSEHKIKHVQSYFMVFKSQVFNSECFNNFMNSIKKEETKQAIIDNYEIGLSKLLLENHFKYDVYCDLSKKINGAFILKYKKLIKENRVPFLKRSITLYRTKREAYPIGVKSFIEKYTDYNYSFIEEDVKKNCKKLNYIEKVVLIFKYYLHKMKNFKRRIISIQIDKKNQKIVLFTKTVFEHKSLE